MTQGLSLAGCPPVYLLSNGFQPEYEIAFANGLSDIGVRVILISSDNTLVQRARPAIEIHNLRGSQSEGRSKLEKAKNLLNYWRKVIRLMRSEPKAIFHFNGLFSTRGPWANFLEALAIRFFCRQWWLTVHNLVPHDTNSDLRQRLNRNIYRLPDVLMVHTQKMMAELEHDWGLHGKKLLHIEHGIEMPLEANADTAKNAAEKYSIEVDKPIVLCFGNIAPYKGADLMIQSLALSRCASNIRLVVIGRARDSNFLSLLHALVREQHLENSVQILDRYVDDGDLPGVLHLAELIALPYRHIDQSGVLFTAKAAKRPVLATPVGSISDYLKMDFDLLAPAVTAVALAESLDQWYYHRRNELQPKAPEAESLDRHLWKNTLKPYLQQAATSGRPA